MADTGGDERTEGIKDQATRRAWLWWLLGGALAVVAVLVVSLTGGDDGRKVSADGSSREGASQSKQGDQEDDGTVSSTTTTTAGQAAGSGSSGGPSAGGASAGGGTAAGGGSTPAGGGAPAAGPAPDTTGPSINASISPDVLYTSGCNSLPRVARMDFTASDPSGLASYTVYGATYPLSGQTTFSGSVSVASPAPVNPGIVNVRATDIHGNSTTVGSYYIVDPCP